MPISYFNGCQDIFFGACSHAHHNSDLATIDEGSRDAYAPAIYPPPPPEFPAKSRPSPGFVMNSGTLARLILIALVFLLLSAVPASAQTTRSANSHATLVSAINAANTSSGDTINITSNITLTADLPAITKSVTINGNSNTINGADSHRAFNINTAGISVTINNLTLANNQAPLNSHGGAISFPGGDGTADLTLNNVTIRDSDAWYSGSNGIGGALHCNSSTLTIRDSRFYNNRGEEGGAINLGGFCFGATITRSAIFNNEARLNGGALHISRGAGVTINNTSIYGNKVGDETGAADGRGAAIYIVGTGSGAPQRPIRLNHVTITGNRNAEPNQSANDQDEGALHFVLAGVKLHLQNTIIYGNSSERQCSRNLSNVPQLSTNVGNIIGSGNCGTPTGVFGSGGNPQLPASATSGYYALSSKQFRRRRCSLHQRSHRGSARTVATQRRSLRYWGL